MNGLEVTCARSERIRLVAAKRVTEGGSDDINEHIAMWTGLRNDPLRDGGFPEAMIEFYSYMRDRYGARTSDEAYQIVEQGSVADVGFLRAMLHNPHLSETHRIKEAIRSGSYILN